MILDNKKKVELLITGIGIVILILLIAGHLSKSKAEKNIPVAEPSYLSSDAGMFMARETGAGNGIKWGRDPFVTSSYNMAGQINTEELVLNGVVSDAQNSYAIINNDVVKIGDKVDGMTVMEINEKSVVLDDNGKRHTLELNMY